MARQQVKPCLGRDLPPLAHERTHLGPVQYNKEETKTHEQHQFQFQLHKPTQRHAYKECVDLLRGFEQQHFNFNYIDQHKDTLTKSVWPYYVVLNNTNFNFNYINQHKDTLIKSVWTYYVVMNYCIGPN